MNQALYHIEIIKARNVYEQDDELMSLISLFSPLNFLFLPLVPFVIFFKSKVLNSVLLHIAYLPVMIIGTSLFFICSMLLYPISYLALLYQNFIDIWEKGGNKKDCWIETCQLVSMIFKGPFVLLFTTFVDTVKFVTSLYVTNLKINNERAYNLNGDLSKIEPKNIALIKHILFEHRNKLVNIKLIIKNLCENFEVHENLIKIIYTHEVFRVPYNIQVNRDKSEVQDPDKTAHEIGSESKPNSQDEVLLQVKQFNLCKNFIVANSIPLEFYDEDDMKRADKNRETTEFSNENESDEEDYYNPNQYIFDINAHKMIKRKKIKRQRVVDASKLLRTIEELEEQQQFKYIIKCKRISLDKECVNGPNTKIKTKTLE